MLDQQVDGSKVSILVSLPVKLESRDHLLRTKRTPAEPTGSNDTLAIGVCFSLKIDGVEVLPELNEEIRDLLLRASTHTRVGQSRDTDPRSFRDSSRSGGSSDCFGVVGGVRSVGNAGSGGVAGNRSDTSGNSGGVGCSVGRRVSGK